MTQLGDSEKPAYWFWKTIWGRSQRELSCHGAHGKSPVPFFQNHIEKCPLKDTNILSLLTHPMGTVHSQNNMWANVPGPSTKNYKEYPFLNISYPTFLWGLGSHECAKYFNTSKIENRSKGARKRKEVRRHLIIHYILPKGHRISQGRTFPITEAIIGHLILNKK